jgi:hypothetical protein
VSEHAKDAGPVARRLLPAVLLFALTLRLYGLRWGLPSVYEEAVPLKTAWEMWGWSGEHGPVLNPHFFNYPSLVIYLHFLVQGITYVAMRAAGMVAGAADLNIRYLSDATPFVTVGRLLSTAFGVGTVGMVYLIGRRFYGAVVAATAAFVLATSAFHIERSQMIEVDVPLAFFVALSLWTMLRLVESPTARRYVAAGAVVGLATSTKYTGVLLLFPLVVAHFVAQCAGRKKHGLLAVAVVAAVTALFATSPYLILDAGAARHDLGVEHSHVLAGHFGSEDASSLAFYARALTRGVAGWLVSLLAAGGIVLTLRRRSPYSAVLLGFLAPYLFVLLTSRLHAERYLLAALPALLVLAGVALEFLSERTRSLPGLGSSYAVPGAVALALLVAGAIGHASRVRTFADDPRTVAHAWIESNVPRGSYIVSEFYGPELFAADAFLRIQPDKRQTLLALLGSRPMYAVQRLQMFQTSAEQSAIFYDLDLYRNADYVIVCDAVRNRYRSSPQRYHAQVQFYDRLEREFVDTEEFGDNQAIAIYRNPAHSVPFADRSTVLPPAHLDPDRELTGVESQFYLGLGLNYQIYGFHRDAVEAYARALDYDPDPHLVLELAVHAAACFRRMQHPEDAIHFVDLALQRTEDESARNQLRGFRERLRGSSRSAE